MVRILTILSCFFLSGCLMVGPNYKEPNKNIANHWLQSSGTSVKEAPIQNANWWHT